MPSGIEHHYAPLALLQLENAILSQLLPVYAKGRSPAKIQATEMHLFTTANLSAADLTLTQAAIELLFSDGVAIGEMKSLVSKEIDDFFLQNWQLKIRAVQTKIERMLLVVRYKLLN